MKFQEVLRISKEEQFIYELGLERYRELLIDTSGNKTELYKEIESLNRATLGYFKTFLKKIETYVRKISTEVIDEEHMTDEVKKNLKEEIIKQVLSTINGDSKDLLSRKKRLKEKLTQLRNQQLEDFNAKELEDIAKMLEDALNSKELKELEELILGEQSYYGEHSRENLQGLYMGTSLRKVEFIQKLIADYIIIYRDNSDIDDYITYLRNAGLQEKNIEEISQIAIDFHINYMRKKYPLMDDNEIFNHIYEKYETNGFLFQGINGAFFKSAKQKGLTTEFSGDGILSMKKIDDIFQAHGVRNVLLSKLHEIKVDGYYYLTDDFTISSHFSFHNPEYMSFLVAVGPYMNDDSQFDQLAFYRRDIPACIENVKKLCERYSFSDEEKREVIEIVTRGLNYIFQDEGSLKHNGILITPRRILKNTKKIYTGDEKEDIKTRLSRLLGVDRRNNYACHIDIPPKATAIISVASLQEKLKNDNYTFKMDECKKFICIQNEEGTTEPFYYDIFIKSADTSDLDCIVVEEGQDLPILESKRASEYPLTVDIINCNSNLQLFDTLKSNNEDTQPSFQSLMMMIAVNGVSNSKKGEELLNRARVEFTPQKMCQYYYFLAKEFFKIATDNTYDINIKLVSLKRIIEDLLPKAIYMEHTNRYPIDINPQLLLMTQYNFSGVEIIKKKIEDLQVVINERKTNKYKK